MVKLKKKKAPQKSRLCVCVWEPYGGSTGEKVDTGEGLGVEILYA